MILFRAPLISVLLASCRPPAIHSGVRTIIIDAIKRMLGRRSLAHVVQKRIGAGQPFIAHRNSATAVTLPISVARIGASVLRFIISANFRRNATPATVAVAIAFLASVLNPVATAALGVTIFQVSSADSVSGAAITKAVPKDFRRMRLAPAYNDQSAEPLAIQINHSHGLVLSLLEDGGKPDDPVSVTDTPPDPYDWPTFGDKK